MSLYSVPAAKVIDLAYNRREDTPSTHQSWLASDCVLARFVVVDNVSTNWTTGMLHPRCLVRSIKERDAAFCESLVLSDCPPYRTAKARKDLEAISVN